MAVRFPAFCRRCGLIFDSSLLELAGPVQNLTLARNVESCPRCGALADVLEGTFDVVGDTIHVLSASPLTQEQLKRLSAILESAERGELDQNDAATAMAEAVPSIGPLLERFGPKMGRSLLTFLWTVFAILAAQGLAEHRDHAATKQEVQQAVEQAIEQCRRSP